MKKSRLTAGILSLILSVLMVVGVFPVADFTASAATVIPYITIADVAIPRPGATPDYTATYSTGCEATTSFDSTQQVNGVVWAYQKNTQWINLTPNSTFAEGVKYTVAFAVQTKRGYSFKTNGVYPDVNCYVNGNKAKVTAITGSDPSHVLVVKYTFSEAEYFTLETVGVRNIEVPQFGFTPDFTAEPISDRYKVSSVGWFDKTARKYLSQNDTFAANHSYTLTVTLNTLPGNKFKTDLNDIADFTAKINNVAARVISSTTQGGTKASITADYDVSPVISKISVSDIEIPKAGKRADYTCKYNTAGYELDNYGIDWTTNGGNGSYLPVAEEFQPGQSYELRIWLKAKEGLTFKTNQHGEVVADVLINGHAGVVDPLSTGTNCQITYIYTVPEDITSVGVSGITEPVAGETADMNGTVAGAAYKITDIEWFDSTDGHGNYIFDITSFSEGREYTLNVTLNTVGNNSFQVEAYGDEYIPDVYATINGKSAGFYSNNGGRDTVTLFYRFKTPVEVITVTGLDAPEAGKTPDTEAISTKKGYKIDLIEWFDTTSIPNTKLSATDKFVEGHKYKANVTLSATDGFIFYVSDDGYQEITGTINGKDAIEYGSHDYDTAAIGYEFTVHTHTPSGWKWDADGHWKECTNDSCKEVTTKKSAHTDANGDEKCDTCTYPMPKPVTKELILKAGCTYTVSHSAKTVILPANVKLSDVKANILNEKYTVLTKDNKAAAENLLTGTGMKIQILDKDNMVINEYKVIVLYDVDGNGQIQAADARSALRASVKLETLTGVYLFAADIDSSGKAEAADARKILRKSVGLD